MNAPGASGCSRGHRSCREVAMGQTLCAWISPGRRDGCFPEPRQSYPLLMQVATNKFQAALIDPLRAVDPLLGTVDEDLPLPHRQPRLHLVDQPGTRRERR